MSSGTGPSGESDQTELTPRCCVVMGCCWSNIAVFSNYTSVCLSEHGSSNIAIGMPVMFFFTRLLKKMSTGKWLILSGFANLAKCAGYYGVQFLQLPAFAVITVASVHYVAGLKAPRDAVMVWGVRKCRAA